MVHPNHAVLVELGPGMPAVCRLGLATRGGSRLTPADVEFAISCPILVDRTNLIVDGRICEDFELDGRSMPVLTDVAQDRQGERFFVAFFREVILIQ
jgi:hypothetical protein